MKKNQIFYLIVVLFNVLACKTDNKEKNIVPAKNAKAIVNETQPTKNNLIVESFQDFVPKDYFLLDSAVGNIDENNTQHIALVCAPNSEKNIDTFIETNRIIILLQKKNNLLKIIASNDALVLCKSCGGIFGDPYNGVSLNNNILSVSNYGGSAWRWSQNYTFRFQQESWELIGATYDAYYNAKECEDGAGNAGRQLEDINFAANKMQILHTKETDCKPYEDYMKKFAKKKAINLNDFPGTASQWPSGKIQDGDGKD